ncbi:MAG: O-antigen ligase family protein [Leptolyngbyaceae cyanobacterium]
MGASHRLTVYDGLLGLALLALAVFAWLPDSYFRMVGWPWIIVWQSAFGLSAGLWVWQLRRRPARLGFGLDWLVLGLLGCLTLASATAEFPLLAVQNSLLVVSYIVLLYSVRNSQIRPLQLCQGLVWVGAIAAVISLALWRPTADMWLSDNFYDAIRNRFPLGHHNFTGGYFVLVWPLAMGLAWLGRWRWGYGLLSVLIGAALYASGSRGAWLGGVAFVVVVLLLSIIRSRGKTRLGAIALAVIALGLIVVLLGTNPRIRALIVPSEGTAGLVVSDGPARDRIFMAQAAGNILQHRPLGLGPGNLGRVYERYRPVAAGTGLHQVQQLHNTPLQLLSELGLGGGLIYIGAVMCLVRLGWQLQQTLLTPADRRLALVLCSGFIGYGVSSLSDYQLENIPIATTLILLVAALAKMGDDRPLLSARSCRWLSLSLLVLVATTLQFWLRTDLAILLTHRGVDAIGQGEFSRADDRLYTAAQIAPWDPTPSALGAQQLSQLAPTTDEPAVLQQEALALYQQALKSAPNDIWFNQNLAVLAWETGDTASAQRAIRKVLQLSPRSKNHSYYLLGLMYYTQGNTQAAIEAFALECLINPQVLSFESWYQQLAVIRQAVFSRTLNHYETVLAALSPDHPLADSLRTHIAAVRWWSDIASTDPPDSPERLLLRAMLAIENSPEEAAELLDKCLIESEGDAEFQRCALVRAWLQPDEFLTDYLQLADIDTAEKEALRSHIVTQRNFRNWLQSTTLPVANNQRVALALLYRNTYASRISSVLVPADLRQFALPVSLNLFSLSWPREFPVLDELVDALRTETLNLPHPTRNNYRLTDPSPT